MGKRKVVSIKKRFRPQSSLAFFLLLLIVVYIVVLAWGYFAKEHISIYEVNTTDISEGADSTVMFAANQKAWMIIMTILCRE